MYTNIRAGEMKQMFDADKGRILFIDVRSPKEHIKSFIPDSYNMDIDNFMVHDFEALIEKKLASENNLKVVFYCRSGRRSRLVLEYIEDTIEEFEVVGVKFFNLLESAPFFTCTY